MSAKSERILTFPRSFLLLVITALVIFPEATYSQFSFADGEQVAALNYGLMAVISGNSDGGALILKPSFIINGLFTNTDYTTTAGRQSLTFKSNKNYANVIWKCVVGKKSLSAYVCINTDGSAGKVVYITLEPLTTNPPSTSLPGFADVGVDVACSGDYCLLVQSGGTPGAKRFLATPTGNQTSVKCAGDTKYSLFVDIDETSNLSAHGYNDGVVIMRTNVDNTAFALAGNVVATHPLTLSGGEFVNDGIFLSYTGFTDKGILAVGTSNVNSSLKIFKVTDGSISSSFGPIDTGSNTSFDKYMLKYFTDFKEIAGTSLIVVKFFHTSTTKTTISVINYGSETTASIVAVSTYQAGYNFDIYPGTSIVLLPIADAAEDMKTSKNNIIFCPTSCKTCAADAGASKCTECINAQFGVQADKVSCAACPANSQVENLVCVCDFGYKKVGEICEKEKCFSQALIAKKGQVNFTQIAAYDGRSSNSLVLVFNKELDFNSSVLDEKIKLSSVKIDGSDATEIKGLKLIKTTSLHLLHLTYETDVPTDRSIKVESLSGFKLVSDISGTLTDIGTQICPKTDSDAQVSNAKLVEDYFYSLLVKKISTTDNAFKTTGRITSINYAVLGMDKIGWRKNLIYNVYSDITKNEVVLNVDLRWIPKEGVSGDHEVVLFYHSGKGSSGDNAEDKKYLSENFMPVMIKVNLSSPLGIMATALIFVSFLGFF